jgi:predicted alpha/beta-hydrolase family hydrolase
MRDYPAADAKSPTLVLAHGAGAGEQHPWMVRLAKGLAARGVHVVTFNFPYMDAGRKAPDPGAVLEKAYGEAWATLVSGRSGPLFAGGKSMGGRIASQVAAKNGFEPVPTGLVFFGYPLHPPGKPAQRRDRHLPDIAQPMLFFHGERDPFGSPDEMADLTGRLTGSTLHVVPGGDHSLVTRGKARPGGADVLDTVMDQAADWMRRGLY